MPIYEYQCKSCGTGYDLYHKRTEVIEDIVCPECGSSEYRKMISVPGITAKNSVSAGSSCPAGDCCCRAN